MVREDLISSAITFLQDPSVASSPIEKRIAFLQSKNLTQDEIDAALSRVGEDVSSLPPTSSSTGYGYQNQQMMRQAPRAGYGGYQGGYWQQPPPEVPRRDWRDWFIMATVMGGVSYGLFFVAKRYVYPLIAPPTPPQLEQDKESIDESFNRAFALLDQLATDTETLKSSEQARTERLDTSLQEVESVIGELKAASRRREEEGRQMNDEVRGLKSLMLKAQDAQKDRTDGRLNELSAELKSLKTLVGNRMGAAPRPPPSTGSSGGAQSPMVNGGPPKTPSLVPSNAASNGNGPESTRNTNEPVEEIDASTPATAGTSSPAPSRNESSTPFGSSATGNRAAIPAWQMAAAKKSSSSANAAGLNSNETSGGA
ncbi:MAG: peroxisomal membrane protein pex14 [Sclerophora amabilis]|nr:MAG: peroxisomal membrane protein pex14 [Sclerophora amabilis]